MNNPRRTVLPRRAGSGRCAPPSAFGGPSLRSGTGYAPRPLPVPLHPQARPPPLPLHPPDPVLGLYCRTPQV